MTAEQPAKRSYPQGTIVTLQAIPDSNSHFSGWSGGCTGQALTCLVTMDAVKTVTARFTLGTPEIDTWAKGFNLNGPFSAIQTQDGGYLLSGHNAGMVFIKLNANDANTIEWQKRYGNSYDSIQSIQQTSDGGFVIGGTTPNYQSLGVYHSFVLKISNSGAFEWQKVYGTGNIALLNSIQITADGGYIVTGTNRGGTNVNHPEDIWVLKLDAQGEVDWSKSLSSDLSERAYAVIQTSDRGYLVGGSKSTGPDTSTSYLVKLSENGTVNWQKSYTGSASDVQGAIRSLKQTSDGGYIVAGERIILGYGPDAWILKLTPSGDITWQKSYDLNYDDYVRSIVRTTDGGYLVGGFTRPYSAFNDLFILRLNSAGTPLWNKKINNPGDSNNYLDTLQETNDRGILVGGYFYLDAANPFGVFKLDSVGDVAGCASGMISEGSVIVTNTNITPVAENLISQDLTTAPIIGTPATFTPTLAATEICSGGIFETITTPGTPSGQTSPTPGISYNYSTTGSTSSAGHAIQYNLNFGDGTSSGWQDASFVQKTWTTPGNYNVTVQARCKLHPENLSFISAPLTVNASKTNTSTSLSSTNNPSTYGNSVTFTASVTPNTGTGTVTFKDGATTLGTPTWSAARPSSVPPH